MPGTFVAYAWYICCICLVHLLHMPGTFVAYALYICCICLVHLLHMPGTFVAYAWYICCICLVHLLHMPGTFGTVPSDIYRDFKILTKCQSKFDCLIYEMLFIKELKPTLNKQSDSIRAKLFI